jgi:hypothetical protein
MCTAKVQILVFQQDFLVRVLEGVNCQRVTITCSFVDQQFKPIDVGVASISRTGAKLGSDRERKAISESTEATSPLL